MIKKHIVTFIIACAGGWCFSILRMPLPWTLGPLVTIAILKVGFHRPVVWSTKIRNAAMIVLGYVMGSPFTPQTGQQVIAQLPAIATLTLITIVLCLVGGYITSKFTGVGLANGLLGSMPGGLSQMAILCQDIEGTDVAVVTLMQTVRLLTVVFIVPFWVLHGLAERIDVVGRAAPASSSGDFFMLAIFGVVSIAFVYVAKYIKMPGPYVIAPIIGTAVLVLAGVNAPPLPSAVIAIAQVGVGIRLGMAINIGRIANWRKLVYYSFLSILSAIVLLFGVDYIYAKLTDISFITAFICTAPGGMTEMGLTAMMVHADLPTVVAFQFFRLMFVLVIAIPVLRWWLSRSPAQELG